MEEGAWQAVTASFCGLLPVFFCWSMLKKFKTICWTSHSVDFCEDILFGIVERGQ